MPSLLILVAIAVPVIAFLLYTDYCLTNVLHLDEYKGLHIQLTPIDPDSDDGIGNAVVDAPVANVAHASKRAYLIIGDSLFLGSWIARYLVLRDEPVVHLISPKSPPKDVLRHGAVFHRGNIGSFSPDQLHSIITDMVGVFGPQASAGSESVHLVVYFTALDPGLAGSGEMKSLANCLLKSFELLPKTVKPSVILYESVVEHLSPGWFNPWNRVNWIQVTPPDTDCPRTCLQDMFFGKYKDNQPIQAAAVKLDGFLSGHLDDPFLSPALNYQGGLNHSGSVPINLVHVEDAVRAGLLLESRVLEHRCLDNVYTITSQVNIKCGASHPQGLSDAPSLTTLNYIYDYCSKHTDFRPIKVHPVVALLFSSAVSAIPGIGSRRVSGYVSRDDGRRPSNIRSEPKGPKSSQVSTRSQSPLVSTSISSLNRARFDALQVCRVPNPANEVRARAELGYEPRFSISNIVASVVHEHVIVKKRRQ